jgi:hypothetical protein
MRKGRRDERGIGRRPQAEDRNLFLGFNHLKTGREAQHEPFKEEKTCHFESIPTLRL